MRVHAFVECGQDLKTIQLFGSARKAMLVDKLSACAVDALQSLGTGLRDAVKLNEGLDGYA